MNLDVLLTFNVLCLSFVANGAPGIGKRLLGDRWALPLDGGLIFIDGRPLLGFSKTLRGLLLSLVATTFVALLLGYSWQLGFVYAALSMAGDSFSSFLKRRLDIPPSGRFRGLDQLPEALLPMWACRAPLGLTSWDVVVLVGLFFVGGVVLSKVMYQLGIREHPY